MQDLTASYKVLGVGPNTPMAEVKRNYRELAKVYHPDNQQTGSESKFKILNDAFERIKSNKPASVRNEKAAPKRDNGSKFAGKTRIYRILNNSRGQTSFSIPFPDKVVGTDVVFHFMLDRNGEMFNVFIDKELTLPTTIDITYRNKTLRVNIYEGF
jgi:DnaJ-class molecular chaperone